MAKACESHPNAKDHHKGLEPKQQTTTPITTNKPQSTPRPIRLPAPLTSLPTLLTTAAPVPAAPPVLLAVTEQLSSPQPQPLGQHPPPTLGPQENQPVAHPSCPDIPVVAGPTAPTVIPSETRSDVDARTGQEVDPQSRPTWQHPPAPRKAEHW